MASTVARNKTDVDNMARRERLWDSLNYSYGKKRENSDKEFDKAYSQADRNALSRGMGRSSYNTQTLANISKQKIDAQNDIYDAQIADYENRIGDIEQQEAENERWERQFAASREDAAWNKEFQQKQFDTQNNQWQLNYNAGREDAAWNKEFQQKQADTQNNQWQLNFNAGREDAAWQKDYNERQYADSRADADWQKQFNERQYADNRADADWQKQFNEQQYADSRSDTAWNQAFQQNQADVSRDQWEREFGFNTGTTEQQIAMQYAMNILNNGEMPSDALLKAAGISKADAEKMKAKESTGGSGKGSTKSGNLLDSLSDEDKTKYNSTISKIGTSQPVTDSTLNRDAELAGQSKNDDVVKFLGITGRKTSGTSSIK